MSGSQRSCIHHQGAPAIAVCTRCNGDICGECHGVERRGLAVCQTCQASLAPPPIPWEADQTPTIRGFFETVVAALSGPRNFFARFASADHWGLAAIFGIICVTVGTFVSTLWQRALFDDYGERFQHYYDELGLSPQLVELTIFAAIPFGAVVLYFIHTGLLYLALRAIDIEGVSWSLIARITGYSLGAYLLMIAPPISDFSLGHFLMVVWLFNLEVSAVRWFFGIGFWKSMGIVLLPFMVFLLAIA